MNCKCMDESGIIPRPESVMGKMNELKTTMVFMKTRFPWHTFTNSFDYSIHSSYRNVL